MLPNIVYLPISKLSILDKNPRKITKEQFQKLCNNIKNDPEFLSLRPILVHAINDTFEVYAGNQRVRAAKKLGWKEVPCIIDINLSDEIKKKRIVLDNLHHGEFDWDILSATYDPQELLALGFTDADLELPSFITESSEEDESAILEPGKDEDAITKLGDVYELNQHRIICGDSTNPDDVAKCLNGNEPILMCADPPYGVKYDPSWRKKFNGPLLKTKTAFIPKEEDTEGGWEKSWGLFPGKICYIWHSSTFASEIEKHLKKFGFNIIAQIIWKKDIGFSRGDYHQRHELCWYAVKEKEKHNWQGAKDQSTVWDIPSIHSLGSEERGKDQTIHACQKPIECMAKPIRNNTAQGEGVYDPFLGSGTTLIAAEQLSRICYGIEISPAYCDIIVNRWKNFMVKNGREYSIRKNGEAWAGTA